MNPYRFALAVFLAADIRLRHRFNFPNRLVIDTTGPSWVRTVRPGLLSVVPLPSLN